MNGRSPNAPPPRVGARPHPRWSQATEKEIPDMERRETLMYNGYEKWVAHLYKGQEF